MANNRRSYAWVRPLFLVGSALIPVSALAQQGEGRWVQTEPFTQTNIACFRTYVCRPAEAMVYSGDVQLRLTEPKIVWGICVAGSGPIDGCNECATNPPDQSCSWTLVPEN